MDMIDSERPVRDMARSPNDRQVEKLQLLAKKLQGSTIGFGVLPTEQNNIFQDVLKLENGLEEKEFTSRSTVTQGGEVLVRCDVDSNHSHPSKSNSDKENTTDARLSGAKRVLEENDMPMGQDNNSMITIESEISKLKPPVRKSPKQAKVSLGEADAVVNLNDNGSRGLPAGTAGMRSITSYFGGGGPSTEGFGAQHVLLSTVTTTSGHSNDSAPKAAKATKSSVQTSSTVAAPIVNAKETQESKKYIEQLRSAKEQAEYKMQRVEGENKILSEKLKTSEERSTKLTKCLEELNRRTAFQDFRRKRDQLALDCVRLGKITTVRTGPTTMGDVWEEGYAIRDLQKRSADLLLRKEELEARKRKTSNAKRAAKKGAAAAQQQASTDDHNMEVDGDVDLDLVAETEVIKAHLEQLKRDENALAEERRLLESEKAVHQKELKRCQCEERSRFYRDLPALNDRYLLTHMLGRGGFSEVWKALDLVELREVAVKVHQLNPTWSEERKQSYIKHVTREYTIHRDMRHPRVVQLFDVFEIDVNSFATVLEYCRGIDLDEKLKRQKVLPEKDARAVLMQILSGLRYLHHPYSYGNVTTGNASGSGEGIGSPQAGGGGGMIDSDNHNNSNNGAGGMMTAAAMAAHHNRNKRFSIIHFDLKPANILFDEIGDVKITDFGLSKVIDESHEGTSMELTSQGAGTYWYLPPECFAKGQNPPRISSKVDVWSAGIIFFQMLYGSRPFGEGKTQENVWTENIIFNATQVEFPNDPKAPKVSDEAKELIRVCLTRDQRLRPDVVGVCQHSYLKGK